MIGPADAVRAAPVGSPPDVEDGAPRAVVARRAWLTLAIGIGLLFAIRTSWPALVDPYVVQDDVRQHAFWVPRLHDPALFRDDPIADYYAAQAPPGFAAVYYVLTLAMDAPTASKLLPLDLTVLLAVGGFALGRALFGRSDAAALGSILLCWSAWQYDDLASASARSFAMPLLTLFFAALTADRRVAALVVLALQALVYPLGCAPMLTVAAIWLLGRELPPLLRGGERPPHAALSRSESSPVSPGVRGVRMRGAILWLLAMTTTAGGLAILGQVPAARYGPVVSAAQAREMPEFRPGGRSTFFGTDPYQFWLESTRSGLALAPKDDLLGGLPALTLPFALAVALAAWIGLGQLGWLARPAVPPRATLLLVVLGASLALFLAAHGLLFRLYLPARHVQFTLPIVWALAGGLAWTLAADRVAARWWPRSPRRAGGAVALLGVGLLVAHTPPVGDFYVTGRHPRLYAYLRSLPPETKVAALPGGSSILPLFTQRPVLVSWEHAIPYHPAYYEPLQGRTRALLQAYFAEGPAPILDLAEREGVGVVVADLPQLERRRRGQPLALEVLAQRCGALRERELVAIPIACARAEGGRQ